MVSEENLEKLTELRKLELLHTQSKVAMAAGFLIVLVIFFLFWDKTNHSVLTAWLVFYLAVICFRYYMINKFQDTDHSQNNIEQQYVLFITGTGITGLTLGLMAVYILQTVNPIYSGMLIVMLGGLVAGTVATYSVSIPAFLSFTLATLLPACLYLLSRNNEILMTLAYLVLAFIAIMTASIFKLNRLVMRSLSFQFEKQILIKDIELEKQRVFELNKELEYDLERRKQTEALLIREKNKAEKLADELLTLSTVDGLTGIANRRHLDDFLQQEWQRAIRTRSPLSLILCDIDYFKAFNDCYGHPEGDKCLCQIADIISYYSRRSGDLSARYGGEEFAIVLPETDLQNAVAIAEKMRCSIEEQKIPHDGSEIGEYVTTSFGVACTVPDINGSVSSLVAKADKALYKAKTGGRNRVISAG